MTVCGSVSQFGDFTVLVEPEGRSFVAAWWPVLALVPTVMVGLAVYWLWFAPPTEEIDGDEDEEGEESEEGDEGGVEGEDGYW